MLHTLTRNELLDRMAMLLSGLCAAHCVATALLVGVLASAGGGLMHPAVHEAGFGIALLLATVALGRGIVRHGLMLPAAVGGLGLGVMAGALTLSHGGGEIPATLLGVGFVGIAHLLNRRAVA